MSVVADARGIERLRAAIRHWETEIRDTQAQIARGAHPQHDAACRRYVRECQGFIRRLNREIHSFREKGARTG